MNPDRHLDARQARRLKAEDRMLGKLERLEAKAEPMVGELLSGRFYVYPIGGTYREDASRQELIEFLIRNKYVR